MNLLNGYIERLKDLLKGAPELYKGETELIKEIIKKLELEEIGHEKINL